MVAVRKDVQVNRERTATHAGQGRRSLLMGQAPRPSLLSGPARAGLDASGSKPAPGPAQAGARAWAEPSRREEPSRPEPLPGAVPETLPEASSVLAVIARPGQESAGLGAVLSAYHLRRARLSVLCLTKGEASELNSTYERLEVVRPWELQVAAGSLGVDSVTIADYPDGRLGYLPVPALTEHVLRAIRRERADLVLVLDPSVSADSDTAAVARCACLAAQQQGISVLARTRPGPGLRWWADLGPDAQAVRTSQQQAIAAHVSQRVAIPAEGGGGGDTGPGWHAAPGPRDGWELLRWLVPPSAAARIPATVGTSP